MAIQVKFNGTDRSSQILWETLSWQESLTYEVDLLSFRMVSYGSLTFTPTQLDEVTLFDGGVKVFGGNVVQIKEEISGYNRRVFNVQVKDYSHIFDRRLVIEVFESVPVINIINTILNTYANKYARQEIATFENNEIWSGGTIDTVNFRIGIQGRKLTSASGATDTMSRIISIDLTSNGLGSSDYVEFEVYIDTPANLSSCIVKLGDIGLTNYFSKNCTSLITTTGWNLVKFLRSSMSSTGSPDATNIQKIQIEVVSVGATTVNCTFDNWQMVSATDAFTRDNALLATQVVDYIAFKYERGSKCLQQLADLFAWQWYIDENKDIHFFAKFEELAAYDLTDTSQNFVWKSFDLGRFGDQIRNIIIVRGGEYLGSSLTEDLQPQANSVNTVFNLGFKYETYTLTLNGNQRSVGINSQNQYTDNQSVTQSTKGVTNINVGDVSGNYYQTQEVISVTHGRRKKIKLRIKKVGVPADNFQLQVVTNSSDEPTNTALSNIVSVAGASLTTSYVETEFTLVENATNSLLFEKDSKYHLRASRSGAADASNYYQIDGGGVGDYDGLAYKGTSVPAYTRQDWVFFFIEYLSFEVLYAFNEKTLTWQTAPSAADTITWAGLPFLPVLVQYRDTASITTYGEYEFKIVDQSIKTIDGARQRALQEILQWANEVKEASFITYTSGLKTGQTINASSIIRDFDDDFFIKQITARCRTSDTFEYEVDLVTTKTLGIIYFLQQQLIAEDKKIEIKDNEVLERMEYHTETVTISENLTTTLYNGKVWSNDAGTTPDKLTWSGGASDIWA